LGGILGESGGCCSGFYRQRSGRSPEGGYERVSCPLALDRLRHAVFGFEA
jgi:hypothetical protein